ncbi:MAG: hypothetical protein HS104_24895 [Polyangiaceae bacterium]|nr:hypothetical protein [Polyangiaceae bacterium]
MVASLEIFDPVLDGLEQPSLLLWGELFVVQDNKLDLSAFRQISRFVENETAVLHVGLQGVHRVQDYSFLVESSKITDITAVFGFFSVGVASSGSLSGIRHAGLQPRSDLAERNRCHIILVDHDRRWPSWNPVHGRIWECHILLDREG